MVFSYDQVVSDSRATICSRKDVVLILAIGFALHERHRSKVASPGSRMDKLPISYDWPNRRRPPILNSQIPSEKLEAPPGIEPGMEVLQTSALPLGDGAVEKGWSVAKSSTVNHFR